MKQEKGRGKSPLPQERDNAERLLLAGFSQFTQILED